MVRQFAKQSVVRFKKFRIVRIGDMYSAARFYLHAMQYWPENIEAYLGLIRCLMALKWTQEAANWLEYFCNLYPDFENSEEVMKIKVVLDVCKSNGSKKEDSNGEQRPENALSDVEKQLRLEAHDYEISYVGHCNTTTDIKEANFLGKYFNGSLPAQLASIICRRGRKICVCRI